MLKGNRLDFSISIESYYIRGDISYINYGQWNHLCVTFDGTGSTPYTGNMYINGVDRTTSTNYIQLYQQQEQMSISGLAKFKKLEGILFITLFWVK